jgi:hypothetical protein
VKNDKAVYVCEMTASGAAIGAFVLVYLAGLAYLGLLPTLLLGWLPAVALALLAAHAVRSLMSLFVDLQRDGDFASAISGARPATIQVSVEDRFHYVQRRQE